LEESANLWNRPLNDELAELALRNLADDNIEQPRDALTALRGHRRRDGVFVPFAGDSAWWDLPDQSHVRHCAQANGAPAPKSPGAKETTGACYSH
jgi:hypothetical protein